MSVYHWENKSFSGWETEEFTFSAEGKLSGKREEGEIVNVMRFMTAAL